MAPGAKAGGKRGNRRRSVAGSANTASTSTLPSLYANASAMSNRQQSAPTLPTATATKNGDSNNSEAGDASVKSKAAADDDDGSITDDLLHTRYTEKVAMALGVLGARKKEETTEEDAKTAKICGYVQVNRIADNPRLFEGQPPPENANALKNSMRYNTKQTMVLGKWTFNDALRSDQRKDPEEDRHRHSGGGTSKNNHQSRGRHGEVDDPSSNGTNIAALARSGVLTSLTPILCH
eukprot:gene15772-18578_t